MPPVIVRRIYSVLLACGCEPSFPQWALLAPKVGDSLFCFKHFGERRVLDVTSAGPSGPDALEVDPSYNEGKTK